ncbi:hypothetical protein BJX76DRAFT_352036 [Aspergillus varians]
MPPSAMTEKDKELYDRAAREAERKEMTTLLNKVNVSALLSQASFLRDGVPGSIARPLQYNRSTRSSVMGGMNYHVEIQFEDGISWLAGIRRLNATSPPPDLRAYIMRSEVATLQFLSKTKVPIPKVFDYNLDEENPVGIEHILMEKMAEQRKKVMSQLADIYIELQRFLFNSICSLDQPEAEHVGSFAQESLTDYKNPHMLPFNLIMREECFTPRAIDAYLVHRFILDSVSKEAFCPSQDDGHGINQLGKDELVFAQLLEDKGHADLAEVVRQGRILHRLEFCCAYDLADWEGFLGLFQGLRKALDVDGDLDWDTWREKTLAKYRDDDQLKELIIRHG